MIYRMVLVTLVALAVLVQLPGTELPPWFGWAVIGLMATGLTAAIIETPRGG